jgi:hypothetical protein
VTGKLKEKNRGEKMSLASSSNIGWIAIATAVVELIGL